MGPSQPGPPRGVLRKHAPGGALEHRRLAARGALAELVAHFWWVSWDLEAPFTTETLPHPSVHLLFEHDLPATIAGVSPARFVRTLEGRGHVFGVKLRPAVLPDAGALSERVVPLAEWGGAAASALAAAIARAPSFAAKATAASSFLPALLPAVTPELVALRDLVERLAVDRSLLRVEQIASLLEVDLRTVQRRFRQHVGTSAKWVLQRYRMHEAAERLAAPDPPAVCELALELGYADQAHFARDFKRTVGRTPRQYQRGEGSDRVTRSG